MTDRDQTCASPKSASSGRARFVIRRVDGQDEWLTELGVVSSPKSQPDPDVRFSTVGHWIKIGFAWGWLDEEIDAVTVVAGITPDGWRTYEVVGDRSNWLVTIEGEDVNAWVATRGARRTVPELLP